MSNQSLANSDRNRWRTLLLWMALTWVSSSMSIANAGPVNEIMLRLERSMKMIDAGIAKSDYSMIVAGTKEIEERPMPSWVDRARIFADLGSEAPSLKKADREMKRLALKVAESADQHNLKTLQQAVSQLRQQCETCHEKKISGYAASRNAKRKTTSKQKTLKGEKNERDW